MSDIKCPICGKDLVEIEFGKRWFLACDNSKCRCKGVASYVVWEFLTVAIKNRKALTQRLIHTGKALDVAVNALKEYADEDNWGIGFAPWAEDGTRDALYTEDGYKTAEQALEQITALE